MMLYSTNTEIREVFSRLHPPLVLPDLEEMSGILESVQQVLDNEDPQIRPQSGDGRPGGLLLLHSDIPTVIVPDLHARTGYMAALIDMDIDGQPLLEALLEEKLQVVCVGDGFHSEARGAKRWKKAWKEYENAFRRHNAMDEEMAESLSLMLMVMILKAAAPRHFHFLKGNHENVTNTDENGNRPFGKYAWEGQMVRDWFLMFLGNDILSRWADFEYALPLLAVGNHFLISHAEPRNFYTREELISGMENDELIYDFTWTANGAATEGSVEEMLEHYLEDDAEESLYFGGHRPVSGYYTLRANGRYVQIHNPERYIAAFLDAGCIPDPERDIFDIEERRGMADE